MVLLKDLLSRRNYYSVIAILAAIHESGFGPEEQTGLWRLIDPANNYTFYREKWFEGPGLPFIQGHMDGGVLNLEDGCLQTYLKEITKSTE